MRKFLTLLLLAFCLPLLGQTSLFDSLDVLLPPNLPDSEKHDVYESLRKTLESFPQGRKRIVATHQFRNYAKEAEDSILLRYSLVALRDLYRELEDTERYEQFDKELKLLAGRMGWNVAEGFFEEHPLYGYHYTPLIEELRLWRDPEDSLSFEELRQLDVDSLFQSGNTASGIDQGATYWGHLTLVPPPDSGVHYFLAAHGNGNGLHLPSWDSIDVYLLYEDGTVEEQSTGWALEPGDKEVLNAFNFFTVPLEAGESAEVFLRFKGAHSGEGPVYLQYVDTASLLELEWFRPLPVFPITDTKGNYAFAPLGRSLQVVQDSSGDQPFIDVKNKWEELYRLNHPHMWDWDGVYWTKLRLIGDGQKATDLLLEIPPSRDWASIDVYWPEDRPGYYAHRRLGQSVPVAMRMLPYWRSLIPFELLPNDTIDLYLRLEGYLGEPSARTFDLRRIDADTFWPTQPYRSLLNGFFLGAITLAMVYFLFRGWLVWDRATLYFSVFLLGLLLCFAFWTPWNSGILIMPTYRPYYDFFLVIGQFLLLFGLVKYVQWRLVPEQFFSWAPGVLNGFVFFWLGLNIVEAIFASQWLAFDVSVLPWFPVLYQVTAVAGLIGVGVLSLVMAVRGRTAAYLISIAYIILLVCLVLLFSYWLAYRVVPVDEPVWHLSQAGLAFAILFLALGAGYRGEVEGADR